MKDTTWKPANEPPHSKPHKWSKPVVCVTNADNAYMLSFQNGDTPGDGVWQRLRCFEVGEEVVLWTENPLDA